MFQFNVHDFFQSLLYQPKSPLVFHSVLFITIFTVFYIFYVLVHKNIRLRNIILLIFSLYFYYRISGIYVVSLILIASSDFLIGRLMFVKDSKIVRRNLLLLSLLINIGLLIFFKYTNFLLDIFYNIAKGEKSPVIIDLIAPIGISYFIFKTLSYVIDIYKKNIIQPETSYVNYLLYVSFFPNILAGPILRARDLLPQFRQEITLTKVFISNAFLLIIIGAFKKIVVADFLAVNLVDRIFDSHVYFTSFEYLMGGYAYLIQLYFDFSGYTDMVIGIAMLLGFTSQPNFNKPFLAQNVSDFWRRWHMTLSSWLRDYIFNPLSIRMRSMRKTGLFISVFVTFLLCGLWHGANLTFVVWGVLHGLIMGYEIITRKQRMMIQKKVNKGIYKFLSIFITLHVLMLTFIVFRAPNINVAWDMISKIFSGIDFSLASQWMGYYKYAFFMLLIGLILHYSPQRWYQKGVDIFSKMPWFVQVLIIFVSIIFIYQFYSTEASPFIYLDF